MWILFNVFLPYPTLYCLDSGTNSWSLYLRSISTTASWPERCSPTLASAGASTTWTQPSRSWGNSSPHIRPRRSWARTRSCGWPCATSTFWWLCWTSRVENRRLSLKPLFCLCWRGTCRTCAQNATGPATPTRHHPDPAATALKHGDEAEPRCGLYIGGLWRLMEENVNVVLWRCKDWMDSRSSERLSWR